MLVIAQAFPDRKVIIQVKPQFQNYDRRDSWKEAYYRAFQGTLGGTLQSNAIFVSA